jgi:putative ABC transport system permease protein
LFGPLYFYTLTTHSFEIDFPIKLVIAFEEAMTFIALAQNFKYMLSNYFVLAYRHLVANKLTTLINIFGLSIAVACCITVYLALKNFWTLDDFHSKGDRIYMVEYSKNENGKASTYGDAPALLAESLERDLPQVKRCVRVHKEGITIFYKNTLVNELLTFADEDFFKVFDFPLQYGSANDILKDPNALILSQEMAEKYFPGEMPIGKTLDLILSNREQKQFTIRGIAREFPDNTGFDFEFLTAYSPVFASLKNQDWSSHISAVFVELHDSKNEKAVQRQLSAYLGLYNKSNPASPIQAFLLDNLRNPGANAHEVFRRPAEANHPLISLLFGGMALMMMGLSCFNYINISLGSVNRRLKEIGIRKVIGGTRSQLIAQFMAENLLLCFGALLLALLVTAAFLVPLFNNVMTMTISLNFGKYPQLWLFLLGILGFTAIASGAYPALYVSSFQPLVVFAGRLNVSQKSLFRRVLLTTQFMLAFLAVLGSILIYGMGKDWQRQDWGYRPDDLVVVRLTDTLQFGKLRDALLKNPQVQSLGGTEMHIGENLNPETIEVEGEEMRIMRFNVGTDYLQTMNLVPLYGQALEGIGRSEASQNVVVNETFVRSKKWGESAIGKSIKAQDKVYTITGVLKDFKFFGTGINRPVVFFAGEPSKFNYLTAKLESNAATQFTKQLESTWKQVFPYAGLSYFQQKNVFDAFNSSVMNMANAFGYISGLALLIACMGLYGLAAQHFTRRLKEISVRKVLGASVRQVILLVNREFIILLAIAGILSTLICFSMVQLIAEQSKEFIGNYQPRILSYVIANLIVFCTAAFAVGRQSWKVANVQLSHSLKNND